MSEFYRQKADLNASDKNNITSAIVSVNGIYAFRIDNEADVLNFNEDLKSLMLSGKTYAQELSANYQKHVVLKSQQQCGGTCTDEEYCGYLHQNFVAFFNRIPNLGLKLFYAPHTEDGNYIWKKISK